jgi:hypothetical protein
LGVTTEVLESNDTSSVRLIDFELMQGIGHKQDIFRSGFAGDI